MPSFSVGIAKSSKVSPNPLLRTPPAPSVPPPCAFVRVPAPPEPAARHPERTFAPQETSRRNKSESSGTLRFGTPRKFCARVRSPVLLMDEGRKRVIGIMAAILASHAHGSGGRSFRNSGGKPAHGQVD